jgi:hypothetical protein
LNYNIWNYVKPGYATPYAALKFVVEGTTFEIKREQFLAEVDESQRKALQEVLYVIFRKQ